MAKKGLIFLIFFVPLAIQEGGQAGDSNPVPDGHSAEADGSHVTSAPAAKLDSQGHSPRLLVGGEGGGAGDAGEAAAADAAVHGAPSPWIAEPLQPHRDVADEQ